MKLSKAANTLIFFTTFAGLTAAQNCDPKLERIPTNPADFDEPDWESILELAFPQWETPAGGCPRLDAVGGQLMANFTEFPTAEAGKFNPCYYTKAFAGLDPALGGYPTPIDTHYPYGKCRRFSYPHIVLSEFDSKQYEIACYLKYRVSCSVSQAAWRWFGPSLQTGTCCRCWLLS